MQFWPVTREARRRPAAAHRVAELISEHPACAAARPELPLADNTDKIGYLLKDRISDFGH
jgi:hypothetical protein